MSNLLLVQAQVIPWLLRSGSRTSLLPPGDVCVSAPTGSGKTLAYAIPLLQVILVYEALYYETPSCKH